MRKRRWTHGPDGRPVIWTDPPYREGAGIFCQVLPGETPEAISPEVRRQRLSEFYALVRPGWRCALPDIPDRIPPGLFHDPRGWADLFGELLEDPEGRQSP